MSLSSFRVSCGSHTGGLRLSSWTACRFGLDRQSTAAAASGTRVCLPPDVSVNVVSCSELRRVNCVCGPEYKPTLGEGRAGVEAPGHLAEPSVL